MEQRIQYARGKSDAVAKVDGTFIQREKKAKEKRKIISNEGVVLISYS